MGLYFYKALSEDGKIIEGQREAESEKDVVEFLENKGLLPLTVKREEFISKNSKLKGLILKFKKRGRIAKKDVIMFTQTLSLLLKAAIPMDKALSICAETIDSEPMKIIIREVREEVRQGSSLSDALSNYPKLFSKLYVNTVKAGEVGGVLAEVLERLYAHMERVEEFKGNLVNSMVYPFFLIAVSIFCIITLIIFVIPRFYIIFSSANINPPFPIPQLAAIGSFFKNYGIFIFLVSLALLALFPIFWKKNSQRERIYAMVLKFPVIRDVLLKVENIKFAKNLGTLLVNGVPILQATLVVKEMFQNPIFRKEIDAIYRFIREGKRLTFTLERRKDIWHPLVIGMCGVGEETGTLGEMLIRASDVLEKQLETKLNRLIAVVEPMVIVSMGLIVGVIVVSMISAIFSINEIVG